MMSNSELKKCLKMSRIGTENLKKISFHITIFYLLSFRFVQSASIESSRSITFDLIRSGEKASNEADRTQSSIFVRRLVKRSTNCCSCNFYNERRRHTEIACAQISDEMLGLKWHPRTKSLGGIVLAVQDHVQRKWIVLKREDVLMFAVESDEPGLFHFATKLRTNHLRLSRREELPAEIVLGQRDPRYFRVGKISQNSYIYIQHIESGLYAMINEEKKIALVNNLELARNDWSIETI